MFTLILLQRSAVVVHDDKGHSALTRTAASFSKASFVSSISTNGAADDLALDDPDFWTKVVGLAAKQDDGDEGRLTHGTRCSIVSCYITVLIYYNISYNVIYRL